MNRADQIRHRVANYRQQLTEGVTGERAAYYLREIKRLQVELEQLKVDIRIVVRDAGAS